MTHSELFSTHRLPPGVEASACPGALAEAARFPDARLDPDSPGRVKSVEVVVYHCPACSLRLSVSEGVVRNAYPPPPRRPTNARDLLDD